MAAFTLHVASRRSICTLVAGTLLLTLLPACDRQSGDPSRQLEVMKADLDEARRREGALQNTLASKDAELAVAVTAIETMKGTAAEREQALAARDKELAAITAERDTLKASEALVFEEIAVAQRKGQNTIARMRYEKFVTDHPDSALVPAANAAINQLSEAPREVERQMAIIDPKRQGQAFQKTFNEGYMTLAELAPVLKKKSLTQVLALLGRPNQTFNRSTELGYADRAVNPATGRRGMLIIGFDSGTVADLRVEYAGQKFVP